MAKRNQFLARVIPKDLTKVIGKKYRRTSLQNYFLKFVSQQGLKANLEEKAALLGMFEELNPIDIHDAMLCANIVRCQKVLVDLSSYTEKYALTEEFKYSSSKKFMWSIEKQAHLSRNLKDMIENRQNYLKTKVIDIDKLMTIPPKQDDQIIEGEKV